MFIITPVGPNSDKNCPYASFLSSEKGQAFYDSLSDDVKAKYRCVESRLGYPYYWIWTWDFKDHRDKSKHVTAIATAKEVDAFVRHMKRDRELEAKFDRLWDAYDESKEAYEALSKKYGFGLERTDDQYMYLGIMRGDGVSYALQKDLGEIDYDDFGVFDHEHIDGYMLDRIKSMGVERALLRWKEEIEFKKERRKRHKISRLVRLLNQGKLSASAEKKLNRLAGSSVRVVEERFAVRSREISNETQSI